MNDSSTTPIRQVAPARFHVFKLIFVPLLVFSLIGQLAVVWTQLEDIRAGHFDFVLYYTGAKIISDGHGRELYDLELQKTYQKDFAVAYTNRDLPYNHPPYELLLLLPLARLSFPVAHALWAIFNLFLLALVLVRLLAFVDGAHKVLFGLMVFAHFPTITALKMGQDSVITALLLTETFVSLKRKRYALAGSLLALGLYKPQFVLPLAGILLLHRRWAALFGFMFTGTVLAAISLKMVGWDGLIELFSLWIPMTQRGHVVWPELMTNLRGLVYMISSLGALTVATNWVTLVLSILAYFLTLSLWPRNADQQNELFDLRFALAVVTTVLVSFHLYSYDGTLLVIPLVIMLNRVLKEPSPSPKRHRMFLILLIALFLPLVPNVLLSAAVLAWWALPLPFLYAVIAVEIRSHSAVPSPSARI
jgi:hypothetical protein